MPNALNNANAVNYAELTDEHITDIAKSIELFVASEEYWDKFCHHSKVARGHKTFSTRRLVKPIVRKEDVQPRAEFVAPRPTKIVVQTFEKTVRNYGNKAVYSKEDMQYHFDNTVNNITDVLKEIAVQELDFVKGAAFFNSKCTVTYDTSLLKTLDKAAIILRKNGAKRWDGRHYLAHLTPELKAKLIGELETKGASLGESVKVKLGGREYDFDSYKDWIFSDTIHSLMYNDDGTQNMVLMGKRGIDGQSPVDVAKLEGEGAIQLFNNGLGTGILEDVDGNLTADDNRQQGSVAINMDGLGAAVSDDLCLLNCKVTVAEIEKSPLADADRTGFVSMSPYNIEVKASGVTGASYVGVEARDNHNYAARSTVIKVTTTATPAAANKWSIMDSANSQAYDGAKIVGVSADFKTIYVEVGQDCATFTVKLAS